MPRCRGEEVTSQALESVDIGAVREVCAGIDRAAAEVGLAGAADGIERFEREAERIDAHVTPGAARIGAVFLGELPYRQVLRGFVLGQRGTSFGGRGSFSPRRDSANQLPRRIGLVREAPDCFASVAARRGASAGDLSRHRRAARRRRGRRGCRSVWRAVH